jgi:RNA polymerase sigma-70 factor, ECF subfamily
MSLTQTQLTDTELVPFLQSGDAAAFDEIVRRYERKVFSLARSLTHNESDAQDALQETFLSVFKKIRSFRGQAGLSTWIYRIAVNAALMNVRKRRRQEAANVPLDDYLPRFDESGHRVTVVPDWPSRGDDVLMRKELAAFLRQSIRALDPEYRAVFVLRDQEGLSNEEVAEILKLSVPAVKSRLHRARLFLRERIKRFWYGTEGGS